MRTSSTRATGSTSIRPRPCSTSTRCARRSAGSTGLHVAIVGDVLHSRVARSLIEALDLVGAHTTLVGPPTLMPRGIEQMGCEVSSEIGDDRDGRRRLRPPHAARAHARRSRLRARRCGSTRRSGGSPPARLRPGQIVMHPGPMNRGVEIDPQRRRLRRLPDHRAGALRPRRPDGGALRPARRRPDRRRARAGGRMTLVLAGRPGDTLTIRGARVIDPSSGLDGAFDVTIEDGIIVADRARRRGRPGARARSGVRRPSRAPARAGPRGRGDDRVGHGRGCRRWLLRHPRDAEHRPGRRLRRRARRADRAGTRGCGDPDRLHGLDLEGPRRARS